MTSITVITSTYNALEDLPSTAASIRQQNLKVQWIVADGGSKDGTLDWINNNLDVVNHYFSSVDFGVYDAWNKAIPFIENDWVLFLGAGDCLAEARTVSQIIEFIELQKQFVPIIFGDVALVNQNHSIVEVVSSNLLVKQNKWSSGRPTLPHHQGILHHRSIFANSSFDINYRIAADGKLLIPYFLQGKVKHFPKVISTASLGGLSTEPKTAFKTALEIRKINRELGIGGNQLFHQFWFLFKCWIKSKLSSWVPNNKLKYAIDAYRVLTGRGKKWTK